MPLQSRPSRLAGGGGPSPIGLDLSLALCLRRTFSALDYDKSPLKNK